MKKGFFIGVLVLIYTVSMAQKDSIPSIDTVNMARIYVIRATGYAGSAVNFRVLVDDVSYCKVKNNRYAVLYVQPGAHMFNATSWDKPRSEEKFALKLTVEAGKTYYMNMRIRPRVATTEFYLDEITYNTAAPLLEKYKQDECD